LSLAIPFATIDGVNPTLVGASTVDLRGHLCWLSCFAKYEPHTHRQLEEAWGLSVFAMPKSISNQTYDSSHPSTWVDTHGDALFRFALLRVRDQGIAEEVVQETLLAALGSRETYAGQANERTWMIGILRHKVVDHFRKQSQDLSSSHATELDEQQSGYFDSHGHWKTKVPTWPATEGEEMSKNDFRRVLDGCMGKLPDSIASVFTLREMEGLGTRKICKILGITATNLGARLYRARMALRKCLEINWFMNDVRKGAG
jgi:RNA polymerase sigma-70 factor (ECF subfamily)